MICVVDMVDVEVVTMALSHPVVTIVKVVVVDAIVDDHWFTFGCWDASGQWAESGLDAWKKVTMR